MVTVGVSAKPRKRGKIATARREAVVDATWRVIMKEGLAQTSMRAIADELDCSTGVLTHHFRDKNAVMAMAMDKVGIEVARRMDLAADKAAIGGELSAEANAFLPFDAKGKKLWSVWLQFLVHALSEQAVLKRHRRHYDWLRQRFMRYLCALNDNGLLRPNSDLDLEVEYLVAVLDGLGVNALIAPRRYDKKKLAAIIETHIQRLLATTSIPRKANRAIL